jgi:hypothetical protein
MLDDGLIDRLVKDLKPVRPRNAKIDALIIVMLCGLELALYLGMGNLRPDMPMAMHSASFWWKLGSVGLIAVTSGTIAILSFNPTISPRRGLRWLALLIVLCLIAGWFVDAAQGSLETLINRLNWWDGLHCVYKMVSLSIPPIVALGLLMRRGAATDSAGTALAVGVASAAWGAFVFVFACPYDDPLYIVVWYIVGCGLVTLAARLLLPLIVRW